MVDDPKKSFTYKMCVTDCDGWVDASRFLPLDYDLVYARLEDKTIAAWHAGRKWDGLHLKPGSNVKYWKKKED